MNFPFTEVDFGGDDPSAPIIQPSNGASQPRAPSKTKKNALDTSQVTNSKVSFSKTTNFWQNYTTKNVFFCQKLNIFWIKWTYIEAEAIHDSSKEAGF